MLGLLAVPVLWRLHRRARPHGDRAFSAYFLLPRRFGEGRVGARLRSPWLLALRIAAVAALVVAIVGPQPLPPRGTLVLAAGPFEPDPEWPHPLTIVRAGMPPSWATDPAVIAPVDASPAWGAALAFGRKRAPRAAVARVAPVAPPANRVTAAGAGVDGDLVVVTATAIEAPELHVGGRVFPMTPQGREWRYVGGLPPGAAEVSAGNGRPWPVCLPDARPIPVAEDGWPSPIAEVLDILPGLVRVPAERAVWRPGPAPAPSKGWAAFAPTIWSFELAAGPADRTRAPLWPAGRLPPPGAVAERWRALPDDGEPLYFAGDAPVIDFVGGIDGAGVRFGFRLDDTDLPATAGWPVLFDGLLTRARRERSRCRVVEAGRSVLLASDEPAVVTGPHGGSRRFESFDGIVVVDGLDTIGIHRLEAAGIEAAIAVVRPLELDILAADASADELRTAGPVRGPPVRRPFLVAAALILVCITLFSRRARTVVAWLPVLAAGLSCVDVRLGSGEPGPIVVAVDTSASMPAGETTEAVAALEAAIGERPRARVEGDDDVRRAGRPLDPPAFGGRDTMHGPLLSAAGVLAGERGAIVLVSDGRARDAPVASARPVFVLPVGRDGLDAAVVEASATQVGNRIFAHAAVTANADTTARVVIGGVSRDVAIVAQGHRTVYVSMPAPDLRDPRAPGELEVRVEAVDDVAPDNDVMPVPIEGASEARAIAIGDGAVRWATAAGFEVETVRPARLAEGGVDLPRVRVIFVHDQPIDSMPAEAVARLEGWIAAGGVLVLAGRTRAFGPGGWTGSRLEALSPLVSDPRPPGAGRLGVALLLDRSGSMAREAGGIGPEQVGGVAASLAAGLRGPNDQLAVVAFGMDAHILLPPTPAARVRASSLPVPALARGGTSLGPGLLMAAGLLESIPVDARVVVAITDGRVVETGPDADSEVETLIGRLRRADTRLVALLVGDDPSPGPFGRIASATGGRVVEGSGDALPRLLSDSLLRTARGELLVPGGVPSPEPAWASRVGGTLPRVAERVRVGVQSNARVLARIAGDPLIAEWHFGRGRVIAIATDALGLGDGAWTALLAPGRAARPRDAVIYARGDRLHLEMAPWDPPPSAPAEVVDRAGRVIDVPWRSVGPGRAVAAMPAGPVEVLTVTAVTGRGAAQARVTRPPASEVNRTGVDRDALSLQAAVTGGRILKGHADLDEVFGRVRAAGTGRMILVLAWLAWLMTIVDAAAWAGHRMRMRSLRRVRRPGFASRSG